MKLSISKPLKKTADHDESVVGPVRQSKRFSWSQVWPFKPRSKRRVSILVLWTRRYVKVALDSPVIFRRNKTFIFFTYLGFIQWIMWLFLLLLALNYANNVAMICVCVLIVLNILGIFQNYMILRSVTVTKWNHDPHAESDRGRVQVEAMLTPRGYRVIPDASDPSGYKLVAGWWRRLLNNSLRSKLGSRLVLFPSATYPLCYLSVDDQEIPLAFEADDQGIPRALAIWEYEPRPSGMYRYPLWTISTTWPAGVPRSWEIFRPAGHLSIIPDPLPAHATAGVERSLFQSTDDLVSSTSGLPDGVRALSDREPRVRLAWRATLRHRIPMVATWEDAGIPVFLIPWPTDELSVRDQASLVYSIVREAVQRESRFRITHPHVSLLAGIGEAHAINSIVKVWKTLEPEQDWALSDLMENTKIKRRS